MTFQNQIFSKIVHPAGSATPCKWEEPRHDAHIPRGGDFIQAEGNHMKLSQGLPFVLAVNGGEILVHIIEDFNVQLHQVNFPMIVYVEPGPNVSTLNAGTSFTLFIRGRLFLVQVLRVLRQPETREAASINLLSLCPRGAVGAGSEDIRVAPCTGSKPLPSAETVHHRLRTPESPCSETSLNFEPSLMGVQLLDRTLEEPSLLMQMPIPTRIIDLELLSPDYGWSRTTSPLPLTDTEPEHDSSSSPFTSHTESKNFVCPLRTPDTPSQINTDRLTPQRGSLLSRNTPNTSDPLVHKDRKIDGIQPNAWPSPILVPFGSGKNLDGHPNPKTHLAPIFGSTSSRRPRVRFSSLKPELDPKVVNNRFRRSPFPAPIGTGRPHDPVVLPRVDQSLPLSNDDVLPGAFDRALCPATPTSAGVSSTKQEYQVPCIMERESFPVVPTDKDMATRRQGEEKKDCLKRPNPRSPCFPFHRNVEKQCKLFMSLLTS